MTKIFICGDPQGSFQHAIDTGLSERPESAIVLGYLELTAKLYEVLAPLHRLTDTGHSASTVGRLCLASEGYYCDG